MIVYIYNVYIYILYILYIYILYMYIYIMYIYVYIYIIYILYIYILYMYIYIYTYIHPENDKMTSHHHAFLDNFLESDLLNTLWVTTNQNLRSLFLPIIHILLCPSYPNISLQLVITIYIPFVKQ